MLYLQVQEDVEKFELNEKSPRQEETNLLQILCGSMNLTDFCFWLKDSETFEALARKLFER